MNLLTTMAGLLGADERIRFEIVKSAEKITLLITPQLGEPPEDIDDASAQVRAALATPLMISAASAEELDAALPHQLAQYRELRTQMQIDYDSLAGVKAAAKGATRAASTVRKKASGTSADETADKSQGAGTAPAPQRPVGKNPNTL